MELLNTNIAAGVASMPERERSLADTVKSILPQVDRLYVYLNNYDHTPVYLKHPKITVIHSNDAMGDLGDAGKFYACSKHIGYFFTLDDDLEYPPDYVSAYISKIEKYLRARVISTHGRAYDKFPIDSYYKSHKTYCGCLHDQDDDTIVHVGGTGVMAWHSDTVKPAISDFKTSNMADIWMAVLCNKLKVPILSIAHRKRWIRESKNYDRQFSIWAFCHQRHSYQTKIMNEQKWNPLP